MSGPTAFEEVELGATLETHSRTITEADVRHFAGVSGDFNPLHVSEAAAQETPFGEPIAHGALQVAITTGLLWQSRHERPDVVALYGIDSLRFLEPVTMGTTVHVESTPVEKTPREHPVANGVVRSETDLVTATDDVVMACELLALVR